MTVTFQKTRSDDSWTRNRTQVLEKYRTENHTRIFGTTNFDVVETENVTASSEVELPEELGWGRFVPFVHRNEVSYDHTVEDLFRRVVEVDLKYSRVTRWDFNGPTGLDWTKDVGAGPVTFSASWSMNGPIHGLTPPMTPTDYMNGTADARDIESEQIPNGEPENIPFENAPPVPAS